MILRVEIVGESTIYSFLDGLSKCNDFAFLFLKKSKSRSNYFAYVVVSSFGDTALNELFEIVS